MHDIYQIIFLYFITVFLVHICLSLDSDIFGIQCCRFRLDMFRFVNLYEKIGRRLNTRLFEDLHCFNVIDVKKCKLI